MKNSRSGFALTEALVALALLVLASVATVGLVVQSADALRRAATAEREVSAATEALTRVSLWTRDRLVAEAGWTRVAGSALHIGSRSRDLFEVVVVGIDDRPLLQTTVFRPDNAP